MPSQRLEKSRITAAATTGPAKGPRPASSTPATVARSPDHRASSRASRRQRGLGTGRSLAAGGDGSRPLLQTGGLALLLPQVEELRATHLLLLRRDDGDARERRRVQRERALDADALGDLPHRERLPHPRTADVGDEAAELLLPLLVTLDHAHHDLDGESRS